MVGRQAKRRGEVGKETNGRRRRKPEIVWMIQISETSPKEGEIWVVIVTRNDHQGALGIGVGGFKDRGQRRTKKDKDKEPHVVFGGLN